jgi:NADH-quinone oxidoreductase subunit C
MYKIQDYRWNLANIRIIFLCLKRLFLSFELRNLQVNQYLPNVRFQVGEEDLIKVLFCLRNFFFEVRLTNISCIDTLLYRYRSFEKRFYFQYSLNPFLKFMVFVCFQSSGVVFSCFSLYKSSIWLEREIWDMFGVYFVNNPDLRRLLTDYGFEGFPLLKDFPVVGFYQLRFDDREMVIVSENLVLDQIYRNFSFVSPWRV